MVAVAATSIIVAPTDIAQAATALSTGLSIEKVHVGFDGSFKVGCWTPISVDVQVNNPCRVSWSIEVADPYGNPTTFPGPETQFAKAGVQRLSTIFRPGRLMGNLRIQLVAGEDQVQRQLKFDDDDEADLPPALPQSVVLVAVVGRPVGLAKNSELERPIHIVNLADETHLPAVQSAYDGLDLLLVQGNADFSTPQQHAIRDWVDSGGKITLAIGNDAEAFRASPTYDWVGRVVPLRGVRSLRELSGLESFAKQAAPITVSRRRPVAAARIDIDGSEENTTGFDGKILVTEGREPLAVRAASGFGQVTFIGVDLDRPPLADWKALPDVLERLILDEYSQSSPKSQKQGQQLSKSGVSDLTTQLLTAIEEFPEIGSTSTWTVMLLLIVYLLLIGPIDYFLVHRLLRNPWATWISFPVMVLTVGAMAIWSARSANSTDVRLNQIDLVDIDATGTGPQFIRSKSWLTVYSPRSQRNRAKVVPRLHVFDSAKATTEQPSTAISADSDNGPLLLSWAAAPESGFGGLYRSGGIEYGRPKYRYSPDGAGIDDLPMIMWSTSTLQASRLTRTEPIVVSDLSSRGYGLLAGTITHQLPGPLRGWMLAYGPAVYYGETNPRTGESAVIEPGAVWSPSSRFVRQQELKGYLTKTRLKEVEGGNEGVRDKPEYRLAQTEYDPFSRDPGVILRMMTFYRRAGGKKYTRLTNDSERRLDFSDLLDLDRAVLFARTDEPVTELQWNESPVKSARRSAFVRIVLPVKQSK